MLIFAPNYVGINIDLNFTFINVFRFNGISVLLKHYVIKNPSIPEQLLYRLKQNSACLEKKFQIIDGFHLQGKFIWTAKIFSRVRFPNVDEMLGKYFLTVGNNRTAEIEDRLHAMCEFYFRLM